MRLAYWLRSRQGSFLEIWNRIHLGARSRNGFRHSGVCCFVANSLVFLLIGVHEASRNFAAAWLPAAIAVLFVTLGRAAAVYPVCLVFFRSRFRVTRQHQHVLFWGGLRGALALALVLGLPEEVPRREEIITVSFAVVAFSVFVQGLTIRPLLRAIGEIPATKTRESH